MISLKKILKFVSGDSSYRTTETPIGVWLDNTVVFRKVINFGRLPSTSGNAGKISVAHGIQNLGRVINLYGVANNGSTFIPMPYYNLILYIEGANVSVSAYSSAFVGYTNSYVVIEYTRTETGVVGDAIAGISKAGDDRQ